MWAFLEIALRIIAVILPSLFGYQAGKKSVQSDIKDKVISDAEKSNSIDLEIAKSYSDPDARKRLRDKWSE